MPEKATATQTALAPTTLRIVEPESLVARIGQIRDSIARRAFELFEGEGQPFGREAGHWLKAEGELLHPAHIEISETDDSVEVRAEAPGFGAKELEVSVEPWRVTISGKKESKEERKSGKNIYKEQCSNEILRVVDLPVEIEPLKAAGTLKNGVLVLSAPKVAQVKTAAARTS